ncbi:lipopolysaccharide transport system permease protein [Polaromonas sp. YR568]|uniref:ABC transporter permease n=1 Tax=Polaromonas sp. YR568 TaxID=1855301 RepID=UPI0008EA137A|nr:ABC transporter permease [Polaromonas sp. YR568]SFV01829.1 lipopolysaccharide transport system permease protein [Polaromonas sp. YR568]
MNTVALNPLRIISDIWRHRYLLGQLIKRDVLLRYRGAMFGVLWVFLSPLLMLGIFAFIFGQVFQTRWPQQDGGLPFWLLLYSGLIIFNIFAETVSRAPTSVRGQPSFVKKIIFPVDILPIVPLGAALVHGAFNFLILVAALGWAGGLHGQIVLFPVLLLPVILLAVGLSWFVAAWGVFIKDMSQIVPVFVQMLMFLSPVFYPVSAVPEVLRPAYQYNPLGIVIEASRAVVTGASIDWGAWGMTLGLCLGASVLGYAFFKHSREEFADAL